MRSAQPSPEELATIKDGAPERFVPGIMRGHLIEVEHLARYWWAGQFAPGRRVLDAGCGAAYGTRMLAEAGASEVVGVDMSESVLEAVGHDMPSTVRLETGDVRSLDFPAGAFDLVVCFEVIEHVEKPEEVIEELVRMVSDDGVLIVSTPDRDATINPNPHHLHELTRDELGTMLAERLPHVSLFRQEGYLAAAVAPEDGLTPEAAAGATTRRVPGKNDGVARYVVGLAGRVPLPEARPLIAITDRLELGIWQGVIDSLDAQTRQQRRRIEELEDLLADRPELQERLLEGEQRLATTAELERKVQELQAELDREVWTLRERVERADRVLQDVFTSPSWRITAPLRALKRTLVR